METIDELEESLQASKDIISRIFKIFDELKQYQNEITELLQSLTTVQQILNNLVDSKGQSDVKIKLARNVYETLREYHHKLASLHKKGKIVRTIQSTRLRPVVDKLNIRLCFSVKYLQAQFSEIEEVPKVEDHKSPKEASFIREKREIDAALRLQKELGCVLDEAERTIDGNSREETEEVAQKSPAEEAEQKAVDMGLAQWNAIFGREFVVDWTTFIGGLQLDISTEIETTMKQILDPSGTDSVTCYKFAQFLKGFGPFKDCVENVKLVTTAPWFYGYMSSNESKRYLEEADMGTYLVRFSSSQPGNFVLEWKQSPSKIRAVLINFHEQGFCMEDESGKVIVFESLSTLVNSYLGLVYTKPLNNPLAFKPWFHGDLDAEEAAKVLMKENSPGTFLLRFSSQPGCYAISWVDEGGIVRKDLVNKVLDEKEKLVGYLVGGQGALFKDLDELVLALSAPGALKTSVE